MISKLTRMFGIELEFFLLDNEGNICNNADQVIKAVKPKLRDTNITQECGHNMLEILTFPQRSASAVFGTFFEDFETFLYELDNLDCGICYYGSYPGKNNGQKRTDFRYMGKEKILGYENFKIAQRCIGFHYHYSLPRSSFNHNILFFYPDINERKQDKVNNLHNLFVALDPAIATLMQSSPFYEGEYLGKDSRMLKYRGDKDFGIDEQLYSNHPEFGTLNRYAKNFSTLVEDIKERSKLWKELLNDNGMNYSDFAKKGAKASMLDSNWKPVKISSHGTIESRGADMNSPSKIVALTQLMTKISKHVQNNNISIIPGEIGIKESFKLEGDKIYVPPYEYLKNLQKESGLIGFESKRVHNYCNSLLKLMKQIAGPEFHAPLRTFNEMIAKKETTSDEIIGKVQDSRIDEDTARSIALEASKNIYKELIITKKMCEETMLYV